MATPIPTVPNNDSRRMQPMPWRLEEGENITELYSASNKHIASFWGNDERHPENLEWCTESQRQRHAAYVHHACKSFPRVQEALERIYGMEEMPEEAIKLIEAVMEECYLGEVPPNAHKRA